MPVVEVSASDTERFELVTAPADPNDPNDEPGFVVLRRMSYDEKLLTRDMGSKIKLESQQQQGRRAYGQKADSNAELELANKIVTEWEFRNLVVDHNLRRQDGTLFDFKVPGILRAVNPRVGDEIAFYIGQMNNFEPELAKGETPEGDGPLPLSLGGRSSTVEFRPTVERAN